MHSDEPVAYLGGDVQLPALPGETAEYYDEALAWDEPELAWDEPEPAWDEPELAWHEPEPDPEPDTLPWRDVERLLDRVAPEEVKPPPPKPPLRIDTGGRLRRGALLSLAACLLLLFGAMVFAPSAGDATWLPWGGVDDEVIHCPPAPSDERLKTAMLQVVLESERQALGLDAPQ